MLPYFKLFNLIPNEILKAPKNVYTTYFSTYLQCGHKSSRYSHFLVVQHFSDGGHTLATSIISHLVPIRLLSIQGDVFSGVSYKNILCEQCVCKMVLVGYNLICMFFYYFRTVNRTGKLKKKRAPSKYIVSTLLFVLCIFPVLSIEFDRSASLC